MTSCNENENDNGKIDHLNKTRIDLDVDIRDKYKKYSVSRQENVRDTLYFLYLSLMSTPR